MECAKREQETMTRTLSMREMQKRVTKVAAEAKSSAEAVRLVQADPSIAAVSREIITAAVIRAWNARIGCEIDALVRGWRAGSRNLGTLGKEETVKRKSESKLHLVRRHDREVGRGAICGCPTCREVRARFAELDMRDSEARICAFEHAANEAALDAQLDAETA